MEMFGGDSKTREHKNCTKIIISHSLFIWTVKIFVFDLQNSSVGLKTQQYHSFMGSKPIRNLLILTLLSFRMNSTDIHSHFVELFIVHWEFPLTLSRCSVSLGMILNLFESCQKFSKFFIDKRAEEREKNKNKKKIDEVIAIQLHCYWSIYLA